MPRRSTGDFDQTVTDVRMRMHPVVALRRLTFRTRNHLFGRSGFVSPRMSGGLFLANVDRIQSSAFENRKYGQPIAVSYRRDDFR